LDTTWRRITCSFVTQGGTTYPDMRVFNGTDAVARRVFLALHQIENLDVGGSGSAFPTSFISGNSSAVRAVDFLRIEQAQIPLQYILYIGGGIDMDVYPSFSSHDMILSPSGTSYYIFDTVSGSNGKMGLYFTRGAGSDVSLVYTGMSGTMSVQPTWNRNQKLTISLHHASGPGGAYLSTFSGTTNGTAFGVPGLTFTGALIVGNNRQLNQPFFGRMSNFRVRVSNQFEVPEDGPYYSSFFIGEGVKVK
jgi:hypothetical protein